MSIQMTQNFQFSKSSLGQDGFIKVSCSHLLDSYTTVSFDFFGRAMRYSLSIIRNNSISSSSNFSSNAILFKDFWMEWHFLIEDGCEWKSRSFKHIRDRFSFCFCPLVIASICIIHLFDEKYMLNYCFLSNYNWIALFSFFFPKYNRLGCFELCPEE